MSCIDFPARDALLEKQPDTCYMTSHYRAYATVLVRLPKIGRAELRDLLDQTAKNIAKKTSKGVAPRNSRRS